MEQANFVIIDQKKYPVIVCTLQLKTTYAVPWIFWKFSRGNYFVVPLGPSLRQPGSLLGVFAGEGLSVMLLWSVEGGEIVTPGQVSPGHNQNVGLDNTPLKCSGALWYFNPLSIVTQNGETAKQIIGWTFQQIGHKGFRIWLFKRLCQKFGPAFLLLINFLMK